jgi:hypothetical protein
MRWGDWGFALATMCFVYCAALTGRAAFAQWVPPPTARVVGHVFCADTNAPARLATVTLRPVPAREAKGKYKYNADSPQLKVTVMTSTDGAFTIEHVEPGAYYVIADLPGYLTQNWQFTDEEVRHPTPEVLDLIDGSFPKVQVEHGGTAEIEIQLQRGAAFERQYPVR